MLGKQLVSVNSYISNNRGVIIDTSTKDSVIRGLVIRAEEVVSNLIDINLYKVLVKEYTIRRGVLYRSKRKNLAELISNTLVYNILYSVVLVKVSRTLRNINVRQDNAASSYIGNKLVSNIN